MRCGTKILCSVSQNINKKSRRVKEIRTKMKDQISNGQTIIHIDVFSECLI